MAVRAEAAVELAAAIDHAESRWLEVHEILEGLSVE